MKQQVKMKSNDFESGSMLDFVELVNGDWMVELTHLFTAQDS